ncbi:hypothetical protein O6H91_03G112700 [Diphasiastrum complanatum]|uniref:Uncharacterized protein n=1 Tax=Diphasiastrum complanatum TaxID=34168 RepID=A0ACC2EB23_DIPCM|nr:hypothetical protein O6H91_03G112700 [Diphasiastrum complanatum]
MATVAEGLWMLAEKFEESGRIPQAIKCLEAICQSDVSFLPIIEVKTRLRIGTLLMQHTDNLTNAKTHLERAQLLLKQIPACFELKCRAYSLLGRCYHLVGTILPQKQTLKKGLELAISSEEGESANLWACNFNLQLANALTIEGDFNSAIRALDSGMEHASRTDCIELQMVFATSKLHVCLMQGGEASTLEGCIKYCDNFWNGVTSMQRQAHLGLHLYNELLHVFYWLRACDYKEASSHVEELDSLLKEKFQPAHQPQEDNQMLHGRHSDRDSQSQSSQVLQQERDQQELQQKLVWFQQLARSGLSEQKLLELRGKQKQIQTQLQTLMQQKQSNKERHLGQVKNPYENERLYLGPAPLDGDWLPMGAVLVLVDLMAVICARPKGMFKDCAKRIQSGIDRVHDELSILGITKDIKEGNLQHWAIWMAGVYLILLAQLLENKIIIDLTRTEFLDAQESLLQVTDLFLRFPMILQGCEGTIRMLLGHYAHAVGCFQEAALHFLQAAKITENNGFRSMCQVYAGISFICLGDADSASQALDLIGPIYRERDSIGVREKTVVLFASGLLQMKQHNLQEARTHLASGLRLTHKQLGNHQLVSQYLTVLGSLALAMHDFGQAREILKSSLTLSKALHDIPSQIPLYHEVGETSKEVENSQYETRKGEELRKLIDTAHKSNHHLTLLRFGLDA